MMEFAAHRGFTLVEILIVLTIAGIVAAATVPPLMSSLDETGADAAAREAARALEFARLSAMRSGSETVVTIDAAGDTIRVDQWRPATNLLGTETQLAAGPVESRSLQLMLDPRRRHRGYRVNLATLRGSRADITASSFGPGTAQAFDGMGVPVRSGSVTLVSAGRQRIISVDPVTGSVTTAP